MFDKKIKGVINLRLAENSARVHGGMIIYLNKYSQSVKKKKKIWIEPPVPWNGKYGNCPTGSSGEVLFWNWGLAPRSLLRGSQDSGYRSHHARGPLKAVRWLVKPPHRGLVYTRLLVKFSSCSQVLRSDWTEEAFLWLISDICFNHHEDSTMRK